MAHDRLYNKGILTPSLKVGHWLSLVVEDYVRYIRVVTGLQCLLLAKPLIF